jgi:drug/metabolite transporter (DMT)-like permease
MDRPSTTRVALALATVYIAWGATYPAIAVLVRTVPPLLGMGTRFLLGGTVLAAELAVRRRPNRSTWRQRAGSLAVGPRILGSLGPIAIAEQHVASGLTALLVGSVPLWVVVLESVFRIRPLRAVRVAACLTGFAGLALVVGPDGRSSLLWAALVLGAAAFEASGEVGGSHVPQAPDALWATVWQLAGAGVVLVAAGGVAGEPSRLRPDGFGPETVAALAFLVVVGSVLAYPALVWLLASTPPARLPPTRTSIRSSRWRSVRCCCTSRSDGCLWPVRSSCWPVSPWWCGSTVRLRHLPDRRAHRRSTVPGPAASAPSTGRG